ncbi:MAG TPA: ESPR domain-containing protein, partial [Thauera aminoaromatica]|nr:ESPR domain-containing protein [Thauera aminoaromatica]
MNKSHRIVWSDARNAYIVAGENASAKGKPSSVRKALATAIAALFMGPGLAAAQSCEGQNPLTDAQTSTQCYENVDVTVAAGGSVAAAGTTAIGVQVQAAPYARNFANQGTLEADAEGYNAYAYGVLFEGRVSGSVVNASTGTVSVSATGQGDGYGDGYGVLIRGDLGGSLANAGTIEVSAQNVTSSGYRYAGAYGVSIDGDVDGTLSNSGNVRAESRADSVGGSSYAYTDAE